MPRHGLTGEGELVLDRGELAERALPSPSVVGVLNPEHDCAVQLVAGAPAATIQDVLLQQRVPGLHRGVVTGRGDPPHRALQSRSGQDRPERSGPKLRAAVRVHYHDAAGLPSGDGGPQGADGELGGHALVEGVADDAVAEQVLDRAAVELALGGGVLGDVGQPQLVGSGGGELALDQVVVHRRAGPAGQAALAGVHRPHPLRAAQPVDPVAGGGDALVGELVGDVPVAELRVVVVDVDRGVDQVRVVPVALADRGGLPLVEGLLRSCRAPGRSPRQ